MPRLPALFHRLHRGARNPSDAIRGYLYASRLPPPKRIPAGARAKGTLEEYFDAYTEGPGIWKWRHYFDIYERHLGKFVGREVHVVEVGVFSGGSLGMWKHYFGEQCCVYGINIAPECRAYERDGVASTSAKISMVASNRSTRLLRGCAAAARDTSRRRCPELGARAHRVGAPVSTGHGD